MRVPIPVPAPLRSPAPCPSACRCPQASSKPTCRGGACPARFRSAALFTGPSELKPFRCNAYKKSGDGCGTLTAPKGSLGRPLVDRCRGRPRRTLRKSPRSFVVAPEPARQGETNRPARIRRNIRWVGDFGIIKNIPRMRNSHNRKGLKKKEWNGGSTPGLLVFSQLVKYSPSFRFVPAELLQAMQSSSDGSPLLPARSQAPWSNRCQEHAPSQSRLPDANVCQPWA